MDGGTVKCPQLLGVAKFCLYPSEVSLILLMCIHTEKHSIKYTSTVIFTAVVLLDPSSGNQAVGVTHGTVTRLGDYMYLTYLMHKHCPAASWGRGAFHDSCLHFCLRRITPEK